MAIRNYLIEGVSGAGKTTVAEELQRRGFLVIHGDRNFAYYGDPESGEQVEVPLGLDGPARIAWSYRRWIWPVDKVMAIIADKDTAVAFFCGGTRNAHHFIDLFDAVFVLDVDRETLERRLASRGDDEFGGKPLERALVVELHASGEGMPERAIRIDAGGPVNEVVDKILAHCGQTG